MNASERPRRALMVARLERRERLLCAALLLAIIGGLAAAFLNRPGERSLLPPCPTWSLAGVHCPGCGSTRATHHLLHGRLEEAWRHNPLLVAVGAPLGIAFVVALAAGALLGRRPIWTPSRGTALGIVGLLLAYALARNLPGESFEWLRPPDPSATGGSARAAGTLPPS